MDYLHLFLEEIYHVKYASSSVGGVYHHVCLYYLVIMYMLHVVDT